MPRIPIGERRQALLEAAFRVIIKKGVAAATTRAIAAEAGMPLASFHYVFESRTELMADLIEELLTQESEGILQGFAPGEDLVSTVRSGLHGFLNHLLAEPGRERAVVELTQFASRTPELQHLAPHMYARYRDIALGMLGMATELGYEWLVPLDRLARQLVCITDGVTMGYLVDHDEQAARDSLDALAVAIAAQGRKGPA